MIFNCIDEIKAVVKINASIPLEALVPYINDAMDIYIEPQVGEAIVRAASESDDTMDETLRSKVQRALGPLALALATDELGVRYGDSGITVDNVQGQRSPANEAKIAAAKKNLFYRGCQALDRLLDYLDRHTAQYPDYADHVGTINHSRCFVQSAQEYQEVGLVMIDNSTMTYRHLLPTMVSLQERHVREWCSDTIYQKLLKNQGLSAKEVVLRELIVRYLCNRTAELVTSKASHQERQNKGQPEYEPLIRPLYRELPEAGNFFGEQADFFEANIKKYLTENAPDLGYEVSKTQLKWNSKDKKLFTTIC